MAFIHRWMCEAEVGFKQWIHSRISFWDCFIIRSSWQMLYCWIGTWNALCCNSWAGSRAFLYWFDNNMHSNLPSAAFLSCHQSAETQCWRQWFVHLYVYACVLELSDIGISCYIYYMQNIMIMIISQFFCPVYYCSQISWSKRHEWAKGN